MSCPPPIAAQFDDAFRQVTQTQTMAVIEYTLQLPDGEQFFEARCLPFLEDQYFVVVRNITERVQAALALQESEARYRQLFQSVPVGIFRTSRSGEVLEANPGSVRILAYPNRQTLIGSDSAAYWLNSEDLQRFIKTVADEDLLEGFETQFRRYDGQQIWVRLSTQAMRDADGRVLFYEGTLEDVSIRAIAEKELKDTALELQRSNIELANFAYVASHDLQEPLRMVSSYLQLLQRRYQGQLDSDADEFIDFAVDGAVRMKALINGLLAYSRVGTRGKEFAPMDCNIALSKMCANLKLAIKDHDAIVTHDPLPIVMGDETQLVQLFQNLIGNAIKFRGTQAPRVHISVERTSEGTIEHSDCENNESAEVWQFAVKDNGIGIDPQYAERIFTIFQRLHGKDEYPGTGIGLAICKKIVERHGGRIWVESTPGEGAAFYFTIPANAEVQIRSKNERSISSTTY